jgi:putative transposase
MRLPCQESDQRLRAAIHEIREVEAFYGYRRVTKALVRAGRIGQSQASLGVVRCHAASWLNLPPQAMRVADLTYVRLPEGFVYLAFILDLYSRTCIGWSLSRRIDAQLPLQAAFDGLGSTSDLFWIDSSL